MTTNQQHSEVPENEGYRDLRDPPGSVFASWIMVILFLLVGFLLLGPHRVLDPNVDLTAPPEVEAASGTVEVAVDDSTFAPRAIAVHTYDRLIFHNVGDELQVLTLVGHEDILGEAFIDPGGSFVFMVPPNLEAGLYRLLCTTHANMSATLIVRSGAGPPGNHEDTAPSKNTAPGALSRDLGRWGS